MDHAEFLFIAGEIGIAFTGFAGLVTVVANRLGNQAASGRHVARLRIVLLSSLLLVMAALLPYVLSQFLTESVTWHTSALLLALALFYYDLRELIRPGLQIRASGAPFNLALFFFSTSIVMISATLLLLSIFVFTQWVQSFYVLSIYVLLWVAASMLFRLFILLGSNDEA